MNETTGLGDAEVALIVGGGPGISASCARLFAGEGMKVAVAARNIEKDVLKEEEKGFNQMVLYGRDVSIEDVVSHAKRYPMMSERQVIIVKEAQDLSRTIENLVSYVENPQPTTVLVFCYKYKSLDKRKKLSKTVAKYGVLFESKKLYENNNHFFGDLSAIMIDNLPIWAEMISTPNNEISLMEKCPLMTKISR